MLPHCSHRVKLTSQKVIQTVNNLQSSDLWCRSAGGAVSGRGLVTVSVVWTTIISLSTIKRTAQGALWDFDCVSLHWSIRLRADCSKCPTIYYLIKNQLWPIAFAFQEHSFRWTNLQLYTRHPHIHQGETPDLYFHLFSGFNLGSQTV